MSKPVDIKLVLKDGGLVAPIRAARTIERMISGEIEIQPIEVDHVLSLSELQFLLTAGYHVTVQFTVTKKEVDSE